MTVKERKALYKSLQYTSSSRYGGWKMTQESIMQSGRYIHLCKASGGAKEVYHAPIGTKGKPYKHGPRFYSVGV